MMESMSADIMGIFGHPDKLTPFLDSLAIENIAFNAVYTDGIHTYNGVFSTLYGLPSVLDFKPTKTPLTVANKYSGISDILHPLGYRTLYFCNGNKDFDNLDFFLRSNKFDEVIGQEDYASEAIYNNWGVTDHTMFDYSLNRLNNMHRNNQPFLAVFMTISAHIGYVPPKEEAYSFKFKESQKQAYEFADLSLRYFFNEASKQEWYNSTIFLLIADHGQNLNQTYDLPLSYFHTPLIIVAPFLHERKQYDKMGLQLDVVPTIMGILKIPYINNTLGIDLRQDSRPFAYFSSDDKIGCLNEKYFLVIRKHGKESLYQYKSNDLSNYMEQHQQLADSMKAYVYSMYQTTQYLINGRKTALP
jgi:phosphoglycerol transferase MdoB-like AlkP superfamily enzyme